MTQKAINHIIFILVTVSVTSFDGSIAVLKETPPSRKEIFLHAIKSIAQNELMFLQLCCTTGQGYGFCL